MLESLNGYLLLAEHLFNKGHSFSEAWNFGPRDEDARSVEWIMNEMSLRWGEDASWINDGNDNPHEATYLKLDISKANTRLGWAPKWNLDQALSRIVSWHKGWLGEKPARELCIEQIQGFSET